MSREMKNKGKLLNKNIWLVCLPGFLLPLQAKVVVEGKSDDQPNMEIIEVYAQKRAQKIEEVGISVSTIKGGDLKAQHVKDSTELSVFAPNLKISQNAAEGTPPAVNIRGVGLVDYNTANTSPVAMYVDEIAVGSASNQIVNLFDIEQIDILRGPQGTLFGRNSTGGAILIRSKRPEFEQSGYLSTGVANNNATSVDAMFNSAIGEDTAVRVALNHQNYDYSTNNIFADSPTAGMRQTNGRVSFLADFDTVQLLIKGHISDWDGIVQPVGSIGVIANPLTGERCSPAQAGSTNCFDNFGFNDGSDDFYTVSVNNNSPHKTDGKGISAHVNWQLDSHNELISLTSYNKLKRDHAFNCDGSPARLCEGNLGLNTDLVTQEFRLQSQLAEHFLTTGIYYADESII